MILKMRGAGLAFLLLLFMDYVTGNAYISKGDRLRTRSHGSITDTRGTRLFLGQYSLGNLTTTEEQRRILGHECRQNGFFPKNDSCRDYFECQLFTGKGIYHLYLRSCPSGTVFEDFLDTCLPKSKVSIRTECLTNDSVDPANAIPDTVLLNRPPSKTESTGKPPLSRKSRSIVPNASQRRPINPVFSTEHLARSFEFGAADGLADFFTPQKKIDKDRWVDLWSIENQLKGMAAKVDGRDLSSLENELSNEIKSEMIEALTDIIRHGKSVDSDLTKKLTASGILDTHVKEAITHGFMKENGGNHKLDLPFIETTLEDMKQFMHSDILKVKQEIRKGHESVFNTAAQVVAMNAIHTQLYVVKDLMAKINHLENLPKEDQRKEIERHRGYLDFLENSTMQDTLHEIRNHNLTFPQDETDVGALSMLELLISGVQIQTGIFSFVISSNVYLTRLALAERNLEDFNAYLIRVTSAVRLMKADLGLYKKVRNLVSALQEFPYVSEFKEFAIQLPVKMNVLTALDVIISKLIDTNVVIPEPETSMDEPDFTNSSPKVPLGSWKRGEEVSYAVQYAYETGVSAVGGWSKPYSVLDRACPTVFIPFAEYGISFLVYRRFNQEKPELISVLNDNVIGSFRDLNRDIIEAASTENEEKAFQEILVLLNNDADVNTTLESRLMPFHYAAMNGNERLLKLLSNRQVDMYAKSINNVAAIHFAAMHGSEKAVKYLIKKGENVNLPIQPLGLSPLHLAVANGHTDVVKVLITSGASVNIKDRNGLSPLHYCVTGNDGVCEALFKSGTLDVSAITKRGLTPLHYAAARGNYVFVEKLLQNNEVYVNALSDYNVTPLHLASVYGNASLIELLVQHGALISASDNYGSTPLHYAAFYGNKEAAVALFKRNESLVYALDVDNKTAINIAVENKRYVIYNILSSRPGDLVLNSLRHDPFNNSKQDVDVPELEDDKASSCSSEAAADKVDKLKNICLHTSNIDSYVNLVSFIIPMQISANQLEFSQIIKAYNRDLKVAQNNSKMWRDEDSIIKGIRETFALAKDFDPEFRRKYNICQGHVAVIKQKSDEIKQAEEVNAQIRELEEKIRDTKDALANAQVPQVIKYLKEFLNADEKRLNEKRALLASEDFTLSQELDELVVFLEFVMSDSRKINDSATITIKRVETFRDSLQQDKTVFERQARIMGEIIPRVQNSSISTFTELQRLRKSKLESLDNWRKRNSELSLLDRNLLQTREIAIQRIETLNRNLEIYESRKISAIFTLPFGVYLALSYLEVEEINRLKKEAETLKSQHEFLTSQISRKEREIRDLQEYIHSLNYTMDQLKMEIDYLLTLDGDLKELASELRSLIPIINKAITGIRVIKDVFETVIEKINSMIDAARVAQTEAEKMNAKFFIYNELSTLDCSWRDVHFKTKVLAECV